MCLNVIILWLFLLWERIRFILYSLFSILYSLFSILYSLFSILYSLFSILYLIFLNLHLLVSTRQIDICGCLIS
jgi:hypothetical protein